METYVELIQRLLEIQTGGRPRSPELVEEDERLMDGLQREIRQEGLYNLKGPGADNPSAAQFEPRPIASLNSRELREDLCGKPNT